jgi:hypothetical protein
MAAAVIGVVGNDVPRQLLWATGAVPRRLTGGWGGHASAEALDLLGAVDPPVADILTGLLEADDSGLDAVIVCNDSQSHLRLFYVLRMLAARGLPPVHLLDLPRQDGTATRRFARVQLERVAEFCAAVTGIATDPTDWRSAAHRERAVGDAVGRLRARRRSVPARVSGAAALTATLAAASLLPEEAVAVLDAATGEVDPAATRLFVTGSSHPDASFYAALEREGTVVVGENHDTGDLAWFGASVESEDRSAVLDGLVAAHFARRTGSAVSTIAETADATADGADASTADAVLALIRTGDDAPLWDLPAQRARLAADGRRLAVHRGTDDATTDAAAAAHAVRALTEVAA